MNNNLNKITKSNLTHNIFKGNILNQLEFSSSINKVFIFTVILNDYTNNISRYWECLSADEKMRANNYYTKSLSNKYIIHHGILRHILSYFNNQSPQDIEFTHNEYGKPFLKDSVIHFNMSHCYNMVSYIIAFNQRVGIDIENHDNNLNIQELASLVLTPTESQYLSELESKKKLELFYLLWTKKESLIKASGQGLSYPINTIDAMALTSGNNILLTKKNNSLQEKYYCYELDIPNNYSGAIAIENKIEELIYLKMNNNQNIFDNIRIKFLN